MDIMKQTDTPSRSPEEAAPAEKVGQAFQKVMEDHGYSIPDEGVQPLRREDLPEAIRSALIAAERNTDKITGRFIGRLQERILGRLEG